MAPTLSKQSLEWIFCQTSREETEATLVLGKAEGQTRGGEGQENPSRQEHLSLKGEGGEDPRAPGVEVKFNPLDHRIISVGRELQVHPDPSSAQQHQNPKKPRLPHIQTPMEKPQSRFLCSISCYHSPELCSNHIQMIVSERNHWQKGQMCHRECPRGHIIWKRSCLAPITGESLLGRKTSLPEYWTARRDLWSNLKVQGFIC